jgi:ATP-binding cassette subfamily F protein 3
MRAMRDHVSSLELTISGLEARQTELTAALEDPGTYAHPGKAQSLNRELGTVVDQLQAASADWERLAAELEAMEKGRD